MSTPAALTKEQVVQLLTAAKRYSKRAHAAVLLAIRHGMRASEVTALRLDQINLKEGWIRVERLKGSLCTQQALERHPGSPLLDEVKVLGAWLRERKDDGTPIVFNSTHGGRMDRSTFFRLWRKLAEDAGLPKHLCHPHVAKHTAGTMLAAANANVHIIRQRLGHRALSSAAVYCRGVSDSDADAVAKRVWMETF